MALDLDLDAMVIPAHIWTPWYGILGSVSGFDSLHECFGDMAPFVRAVETGTLQRPRHELGNSRTGDPGHSLLFRCPLPSQPWDVSQRPSEGFPRIQV